MEIVKYIISGRGAIITLKCNNCQSLIRHNLKKYKIVCSCGVEISVPSLREKIKKAEEDFNKSNTFGGVDLGLG
jgi:hypothetical protein